MSQFLLVTSRPQALEAFAQGLRSVPGTNLVWAPDGESALVALRATPLTLVVVDETLPDIPGLDLVRRIVAVNAFVSTALVSTLPAGEFHEVSEGLGILAQLPPQPGVTEARQLLDLVERLAPHSA